MGCGYKTEREKELRELMSQLFIQIAREGLFSCASRPGNSLETVH